MGGTPLPQPQMNLWSAKENTINRVAHDANVHMNMSF
jgi:hypothetical protein